MDTSASELFKITLSFVKKKLVDVYVFCFRFRFLIEWKSQSFIVFERFGWSEKKKDSILSCASKLGSQKSDTIFYKTIDSFSV